MGALSKVLELVNWIPAPRVAPARRLQEAEPKQMLQKGWGGNPRTLLGGSCRLLSLFGVLTEAAQSGYVIEKVAEDKPAAQASATVQCSR